MLKLITLGLLAGMFFSSTFILNELMSSSGGHWFWSASLRYIFMFILLTVFISIQHGIYRISELAIIFKNYWQFWCVAGGIGFGVFYAGICFAGDHASGWVVASTFMFTVVASLFVLKALGQQFNKQVIFFAIMIFLGVLLVNISEASHATQATQTVIEKSSTNLWQVLLWGALPSLIASFSYPIGNQLVWQASRNANLNNSNNNKATTNKSILASKIPTIKTDLLSEDISGAFNKIWLMTVGSFPLWLFLGFLLQPPATSLAQAGNTFLVALFSGIIATGLFLYARGKAQDSQQVAGVDATQASEVIFALIGGILLLNTPLPTLIGFIGISLIVMGLLLFAKYG